MLESLVACGALDSTGATRRGMNEVLEQALGSGQKQQADALMGHMLDLRPRRRRDDERRRRRPCPRSHPPVPEGEWDRAELLRREKETLGLYVSSHPLADVSDQLARRADVPLAAFSGLRDGQVVTVGGLVASMRTLVTKKGDQMAFVELDDTTATIEVIVFANTLAAVRSVLHPDAVVMVKGRVDHKSEGEVKLVAFEVAPFEATADFGVVKLRVDARHAAPTVIDELRSLIGEYPGDAPVMLELETSEGRRRCASGPGSASGPTATSSPRRRRCWATPR